MRKALMGSSVAAASSLPTKLVAALSVGLLATFVATGSANAQTGRCQRLRDDDSAKAWSAITDAYKPEYIQAHRSELTEQVDHRSTALFDLCQQTNRSDEQLAAQAVVDVMTKPFDISGAVIATAFGLPAPGAKMFHIDIGDIDSHGPLGGRCSFFNNPFGKGC